MEEVISEIEADEVKYDSRDDGTGIFPKKAKDERLHPKSQ